MRNSLLGLTKVSDVFSPINYRGSVLIGFSIAILTCIIGIFVGLISVTMVMGGYINHACC